LSNASVFFLNNLIQALNGCQGHSSGIHCADVFVILTNIKGSEEVLGYRR
jgi:hypothetical protein